MVRRADARWLCLPALQSTPKGESMTNKVIEPLVFVRDHDAQEDSWSVRDWLPVTIMSPEFLVHYDTETVVTFKAKNGTRSYRVTQIRADGNLVLELQDA